MKLTTIIAAAITTTTALAQLTPPPGAVQGTDRVREQADARIPINAETTPQSTFGQFTIINPGSYYLESNIEYDASAAKEILLLIDADDVTIDLNGFTIDGRAGSAGALFAVGSEDVYERITIRNGTIRDSFRNLVELASFNQLTLEDLTLSNPAGQNSGRPAPGLRAGNDLVIRRCRFDETGGIVARDRAVIERCVLTSSSVGAEINAGTHALLDSCEIDAHDIAIGADAVLRDTRLDHLDDLTIGERAVLRDCVSVAAPLAGDIFFGTNSVIEGSRFEGQFINLLEAEGVVFRGNAFVDSGVLNGSRVTVIDNTFNDTGTAVRVGGRSRVENNTIHRCSFAIAVGNESFVVGNRITSTQVIGIEIRGVGVVVDQNLIYAEVFSPPAFGIIGNNNNDYRISRNQFRGFPSNADPVSGLGTSPFAYVINNRSDQFTNWR